MRRMPAAIPPICTPTNDIQNILARKPALKKSRTKLAPQIPAKMRLNNKSYTDCATPPLMRTHFDVLRAKSGLCVINISDALPLPQSDNSISITDSPVFSSRFPVGSSASITDGLFIKARATATLCFSPPDSCDGRCFIRPPSPVNSSSSSALALDLRLS